MIRPNKLLILSLLLISPLLLSGCAKKINEKIAEKVVDQASNGAVKMDINGNQTTVKTEGGTGTVGENVSLPADWPKDVYVIDGKITTSYQNAGNKGWTISIENTKSLAEVKSAYETKLKESGWSIKALLDMGTAVTLSAEKDQRVVSVMVSSDSEAGKTLVLVGAAEK
ncbi:MAG: hypothetical protein V1846_01675 [Candidatus Komeilibacteria bacterium]